LILKSLQKDDSKVTYKEAEPFTTKIKTPDSSKAKRDLGFKLTTPVEEGISRTVEWMRKIYSV
jgi:dTDP-glucose 4,6-dehydratase